jgi:hypothetical protein
MSPTIELKLSDQEQKIINYLATKEQVAWEELAQFGKNPTSVKRVTLLKVVSELRKKYASVGLATPFNCKFVDLNKTVQVKTNSASPEIIPAKVVAPAVVQMRKTLGGKMVRADDHTPDAHLDFVLDNFNKRVKTKSGWIALNESNFELFQIFHQNVGTPLSKEDLKNKVWPQWGSKVPASWWTNLASRMTDLRTYLPELKFRLNRIVIDGESSFMLR